MKIQDILKKQHYNVVGKSSAIKICSWAKKSLLDSGFCYKEKFYGIKSHLCCQISPSIACQNRCLHCWRAIELTPNEKEIEFDKPNELIDKCILAQRKMITGFKGFERSNKTKWKEAQNPKHFAISLLGEPTLYPYLADLILELKKRKLTSFLVTNGLNPAKLMELARKKALPNQLYISLNSPNRELYDKMHNSTKKDAWKKFNETLSLLPKLKTRKVVRMTIVKDLNMDEKMIEGYSKLIKKAKPDFVEVKGYMSVGFARQRLGYKKMPWHHEVKEFARKLAKALNLQILDEQEESRVVLLGKNKKKMKIK
jgi:tRNA wybutosine-synthesizing protein 1